MAVAAYTLRVDPFAPEYDAAIQLEPEGALAPVDVRVESDVWRAVRPSPSILPERVFFVDGVRRIGPEQPREAPGDDPAALGPVEIHRLAGGPAFEEPEQDGPTGVQTALKLALFKAHFTDNRDVGDTQVLADVAASVGLDRDRAVAILASGEFGEMVRTEEAYWADRNITGVPAFILDGRMLVPGAQDPDVFIRVIENKILAAAV